ncbi:MAG: hypothetical protein NT120_03905 [Candidatus Aenigmarchaeota archaeon]|nr:hypothetical protein [Candidatus Aenigmarchaeota archaeon]
MYSVKIEEKYASARSELMKASKTPSWIIPGLRCPLADSNILERMPYKDFDT